MDISITAQNIELTLALKDYAEKRLGGFAKYTGGVPVVSVEIGKTTAHHKQGDIFEAKVSVTTPLGKKYYAVSQKPDLYEAIDDVRTEMIRELSSAKDKHTTLFRRGAHKIKNMLKGFRS